MADGDEHTSNPAASGRLDRAFAELRPAMLGLAYRITGNRADAEEVVQDAFMRLIDADPAEAIRSFKAYLTTITARLSLNRLRDREARQESYVGEWLPEPVLTAVAPETRAEDVSFALLVVLERLSPLERVVFVLRSAFELAFEDIAAIVGRDAVTCRKIFSRARAHVLEGRTRFAVDAGQHRALLRGFAEVTRSGDLKGLADLLADDVAFHSDDGGKARASRKPIVGRKAVAQFVIAITGLRPSDAVQREVELNGAPGLIVTIGQRPVVAILIEAEHGRIRSIFAVSNPDKLSGLAPALDPDAPTQPLPSA